MAKDPRDQQETDAQRIGEVGTGKIDQDASTATPPGAETTSAPAEPVRGGEEARQKLLKAREDAIAELRRLGVAPDVEETAPRGAESVLDVGDVARGEPPAPTSPSQRASGSQSASTA